MIMHHKPLILCELCSQCFLALGALVGHVMLSDIMDHDHVWTDACRCHQYLEHGT